MTFTLAARGGTPTMRGETCLALSPLGRCILGDGHQVEYHVLPLSGLSPVRFGGGLPDDVPVTIAVGHLAPATVGTVTVKPGIPTHLAVADLLEAVAAEMRATHQP